jgi:hypothetical protein
MIGTAPGALHRACAHPVTISWILGACALDVTIVGCISLRGPLSTILAGWQATTLLTIALVPATLLGYFVGMFTVWPLIRVICNRYNGGPLRCGDRVMVLSGPYKGASAKVCETVIGQGGWELARLDLDGEGIGSSADIFELYCLLKMRPQHTART